MNIVCRFANRLDAQPDTARRWARVWIVLGVVILAVQLVRIATRESGDFHLHRELGRRMRAGEFIYEANPAFPEERCGLDCPYPPFWGLVHVPLSYFPPRLAQSLLYPLFPLSLLLLLYSIEQLIQKQLPVSKVVRGWAAILVTVLVSRYLVRDMLECGVNLALVALAWYAVALGTQQKSLKAGLVLGFATALKCTPVLFIAWWVWKREWKSAAIAVVCTGLFTLSPLLVMGVGDYRFAMQHWIDHAREGLSTGDPSQGVLGEEPFTNMSLRPALARFLMTIPQGHQLHYEHPLTFDFGNLSPGTASWVIRLLFVLIVGTVGLICRQPAKECSPLVLAWECSMASVLILLFSPITWGQHCVGVLPFFYLFMRSAFAGWRLPAIAWAAFWLHVLVVLLLNRGLVGKEMVWLIDSYHLPTWSMLLLIGAALVCRQQALRQQG